MPVRPCLLEMTRAIHDTSTMWLLKQDLNNDTTNRHAIKEPPSHEPPLQRIGNSGMPSGRIMSFPWMSPLIHYPITSGQSRSPTSHLEWAWWLHLHVYAFINTHIHINNNKNIWTEELGGCIGEWKKEGEGSKEWNFIWTKTQIENIYKQKRDWLKACQWDIEGICSIICGMGGH